MIGKGKRSSPRLKLSHNESRRLGLWAQFIESPPRRGRICRSRSQKWLSRPSAAEARGRSRAIFLLKSIFLSFSNDVVFRASAPYAGCRVTSNSYCFLISLIKISVSCPKMKGLAGSLFWSGTTTRTPRAVRGSGTEDAEGTKTGLIHRKTVKRFALLVSHCTSVCVV